VSTALESQLIAFDLVDRFAEKKLSTKEISIKDLSNLIINTDDD
jgi:hypothetical protein